MSNVVNNTQPMPFQKLKNIERGETCMVFTEFIRTKSNSYDL